MHRLFIIALCCFSAHSCDIAHLDLWTCALRDSCMNKFQLHTAVNKNKNTLKRPYLLAVEGPRYKKLFQDCDANQDGCISLFDIEQAGPSCERSCIWRNTMKELLC